MNDLLKNRGEEMKILEPKISKNLTLIKEVTELDSKQDWYDFFITDVIIDFSIQGIEFNGC